MIATMALFDWLVIGGAALLAGLVNALAGGGSFFVFPALIAAGLSPIEANITTAISVFPAGIASAIAYRGELRLYAGHLLPLAVLAGACGLVGAGLLIWLGNDGFRPLVPWLLAFATLVFAFSGRLRRWVAPFVADNSTAARLLAYGFMALVSIYGGFFGAGASIMLLAALAIIEGGDFHRANSMKVFVGVCAIAPVVVLFATTTAYVRWFQALVIIAVSIGAGYFGVTLARRVPQWIVRWIVVGLGATLTIAFFIKGA